MTFHFREPTFLCHGMHEVESRNLLSLPCNIYLFMIARSRIREATLISSQVTSNNIGNEEMYICACILPRGIDKRDTFG